MTSEGIVAGEAPDTRRSDVARIATIALAAFLSVLAAIRYGFQAETVVVIFAINVLVVISRHDLERRIIPNRIVVPAWIAILIAQLALHPHHMLAWLVSSFGAGLFFLVVLLAYPAGMGMGDVKLALLIGATLGTAALSGDLSGSLCRHHAFQRRFVCTEKLYPSRPVPRRRGDRGLALLLTTNRSRC